MDVDRLTTARGRCCDLPGRSSSGWPLSIRQCAKKTQPAPAAALAQLLCGRAYTNVSNGTTPRRAVHGGHGATRGTSLGGRLRLW